MNKKIFGVALIATMAVAAGWNFNQSKNDVELSDLTLANIEALAKGNPGGSGAGGGAGGGDRHGYYNYEEDCCDTGGTIACYYDCPE